MRVRQRIATTDEAKFLVGREVLELVDRRRQRILGRFSALSRARQPRQRADRHAHLQQVASREGFVFALQVRSRVMDRAPRDRGSALYSYCRNGRGSNIFARTLRINVAVCHVHVFVDMPCCTKTHAHADVSMAHFVSLQDNKLRD